jgi:hypothetical protein
MPDTIYFTVGPNSYRLSAVPHNSRFVAHALRDDTGERFGIEASGQTPDEAIGTLSRWLTWQAEHAQGLEALQQAERVYHRAMADAAFSQTPEAAAEERRTALEAMNAARTHLDDVRLRRPNV